MPSMRNDFLVKSRKIKIETEKMSSYGTAETEKLRTNVEEQVGKTPRGPSHLQ